MNEWLIYISYWYIIGLPLSLFAFAREKGVIKVGDIKSIILAGLGGPIWLVVLLYDILNNWLEKRKNIVIWKSKREKVKNLLYTSEEEQEDKYPPYL